MFLDVFWTVSTTSRRVSASSLLLRDELLASCRLTPFPAVRRRFLSCPVVSDADRVASVVPSSVAKKTCLPIVTRCVCQSVSGSI